MNRLIDSSIWIAIVRTPKASDDRDMLREIINHPNVCICEPVLFEVTRGAPKRRRAQLMEYLETTPVLPTSYSIWRDATKLGQQCRASGLHPSAMDLLIATIVAAHGAELVSLDGDFVKLSKVGGFKFEHVRLRG